MKLSELRAELIGLRTRELDNMALGLPEATYRECVGRAQAFSQVLELITPKPEDKDKEVDYLDLET